MPTYEDVSIENKPGFDTSDLSFSFTRPIQLCAMEINSIDNNKIITPMNRNPYLMFYLFNNIRSLIDEIMNDGIFDKYNLKFDYNYEKLLMIRNNW